LTERIEEEDVMPPRVVRHYDDVVIVLDRPGGNRDDRYNRNLYSDEEVTPGFAVTTKGYQFYAETEVFQDVGDPEGEPIFRGRVHRHYTQCPSYRIAIKF
jgi:hypothetical protein